MLVLNDQVWAPEQGLTEVEAQVQETAHRFASDVIRPAGIALDRLEPEEVIAKGSLLWDAFDGYWELGLDLEDIADELSPLEVARMTFLVNEELGWGDTGLGWSLYASGLARAMIKNLGRDDLAELCPPGTIGMWSITHVSALFCRYDDGSGEAKCAAFIVPLDLPGVSRGKPLDKLGVRSLTDAELFFDDVEIPANYMLCPPEAYDELLAGILIGANPGMAIFSVGQARAAFELALAYAKERVQGGRPIFEHQTVKLKLFDMYRKIQAARALVRKTMLNHAQFAPRFENSVASKVTGTQTALEVTNQAFEIFGGNATSKEYPIEKLLRDARMGTIADGTNEVLSLMAATLRF
jgi:acyl-CoA dehydrogenase